ncbi:tetratricopeptide repeat protein [Sphaerothrix gracilis]|uniref:tetratricopeptide repeat protein n=1 Tax=Sphaerothrix gracilis TaxID=3151835 RepID=UPI0031FD68F0
MLTTLWQLLTDLWQWSLDNQEIAVAIASGILGFLWWLATRIPKIWRSLRRRSQPKPLPKIDSFPFEVIAPKTPNVMAALWPNQQDQNDVLADVNIPYQPTQEGRDVQAELETLLRVGKRSVLILGPSGRGKTREAIQLAGQLNHEGWTILKLKNHEWLNVPTHFDANRLGSQPSLLFLLDDLTQAIFLGRQSAPIAEDASIADPLKVPFQERLVETLRFYQTACSGRVRVIATARNETEPDVPSVLSPAEILNFNQFPQFRDYFSHYELLKPDVDDIAAVLSNRTQTANISIETADIPQMARKSDRNYRNIVKQLKQAHNRKYKLSLATFEETLKGTWIESYRTVVKQYPVAKYLYNAVDLLRQVNVELKKPIVLATARMLLTHRLRLDIWRIWQLRAALDYLIHFEGILTPADGQLEARSAAPLNIGQYLPKLIKILQRLTEQDPATCLSSLRDFSLFIHQLEKYELAVTLFAQVLEYEPKDDTVWFFKGNALYFLGRKEEAIAAYEQALSIQPDDHKALTNKGNALADLGRKEEAIAFYEQVLSIKPDDHAALTNKGLALADLGHKEEAIAFYEQALSIKPDLHEALYNKGVALDALGRYEEAIAAYEQALSVKPDKHEALYNKGVALSALGRKEEAIAFYEQALSIKPDLHEALYNKGVALDALGRYEEAIAAYEQALSVKPDKHEALYNKGNALFALGRKEEAIAAYEQALSIKPDKHEALYNKGVALDDLGRKEEAIAAYEQALSIKPDDHAALTNKGVALDDLGRKEEAIAAYEQALSIKPDDHEALCNKGNALFALGRKEEAIAAYEQALSIKPDYHEALNNKGLALAALGRKEEAIAVYEQALSIKPDKHEALYNKGVALDDLGRKEEAIACYEQALSIKPDYYEALNNKGVALSALGRKEEAIACYEQALSTKPDLHEALYNKACCYGLQKETELAIEFLSRAIELDSKYREMAKTDSDFDAIRDDERFQQLLEEG